MTLVRHLAHDLLYERAASCEDARAGMRNGYCPTTVKTTAGPVTLQRPKVRGTTERFASQLFGRHRQVIWECLWRSRCERTGWRKMVADCVFQAAAAVMIWFQTAKRLVISVRHSGALIR